MNAREKAVAKRLQKHARWMQVNILADELVRGQTKCRVWEYREVAAIRKARGEA